MDCRSTHLILYLFEALFALVLPFSLLEFPPTVSYSDVHLSYLDFPLHQRALFVQWYFSGKRGFHKSWHHQNKIEARCLARVLK